jgi:hypothetical protein
MPRSVIPRARTLHLPFLADFISTRCGPRNARALHSRAQAESGEGRGEVNEGCWPGVWAAGPLEINDAVEQERDIWSTGDGEADLNQAMEGDDLFIAQHTGGACFVIHDSSSSQVSLSHL